MISYMKESISPTKKYHPAVTGVSLTELEKDIVLEESQKRGLHNFSATLRMIIREWAKFTRINPDNGNPGEES